MNPAANEATLTAAHSGLETGTGIRSEDLRPGLTRIHDRGRYEVVGEHGRGGLGRVLRARDSALGRDVAIKELIQRGGLQELRFLREAVITARLEHPGIVPIHEAGRWDDGTPFYAMKLVSGRPLKDLIAARTSLDQRLGLLQHVVAVADAIAYAHGKRIIHRDLKPGNVIVGEFGETVVIDWGLAKDLAASDAIPEAGPLKASSSPDLTTAGGVLGTPAYMAPEQARGEAVDQRVDVYAIGAMLWELCAGTRAPPSDACQRERVLRRSGIDGDLATIIGKALAPEPGDRYGDAGELASDLKAFQAGARIAARSYSLPATLAHWIRRHRTLSISVAAAVLIMIAGAVEFVRNIALERDRADASAVAARREQRRAEQIADQLTLEHAELQLHSDPTAAIRTLETYRGSDPRQLQRLAAEAIGRGVASSVRSPHGDRVTFVAGDASGAVVSVSDDRTIRITRGAEVATLARNALVPAVLGYAAEAGLIAYGIAPSGIGVIALASRAITPIDTPPPQAIAIASDGARLAAISDGWVTIWRLAPGPAVIHQERIADATGIGFVTPDRLAVSSAGGLRTIALAPGAQGAIAALPVLAFDADASRIAISDLQGKVALLSPDLAVHAQVAACQKSATAVSLIPHSELVAFTCEEGMAGVARYDAAAHSLAVIDTFATVERPYRVKPDARGRYAVVSDDSNLIYVYDVAARIVRRYAGQAQVWSIAAPTSAYDHVLVGDAKGTVQVWDPPPPGARKIFQGRGQVNSVEFSPDGGSVIAAFGDLVVRRIELASDAVTEYRGHTGNVLRASFAPDGQSMLTYSSDGTARVWRPDGAVLRVVGDHRRPVTGAWYIEGGRRVASIGRDGRLRAWSPGAGDTGEISVLHQVPLALTSIEIAARGHIIVLDAAGAIYDVAPGAPVRQVRIPDTSSVTLMHTSRDGEMLAVGTDAGSVTVYRTADWTVAASTRIDGQVRQLRFEPHNRDLVIVSER